MALWKDMLGELDHRNPLPPLHPTDIWDEELSQEVSAAGGAELMGEENPTALSVKATRAGLLLWNDDLDAAHQIVQDIDEDLGSYWHAILHRREGDYDNAKYWFARVGQHPIFDPVYQQASRLWPGCQSWGTWNANAFVDAVERVVESGEESHADGERLRRIQVVEFSFLLRHGLTR